MVKKVDYLFNDVVGNHTQFMVPQYELNKLIASKLPLSGIKGNHFPDDRIDITPNGFSRIYAAYSDLMLDVIIYGPHIDYLQSYFQKDQTYDLVLYDCDNEIFETYQTRVDNVIRREKLLIEIDGHKTFLRSVQIRFSMIERGIDIEVCKIPSNMVDDHERVYGLLTDSINNTSLSFVNKVDGTQDDFSNLPHIGNNYIDYVIGNDDVPLLVDTSDFNELIRMEKEKIPILIAFKIKYSPIIFWTNGKLSSGRLEHDFILQGNIVSIYTQLCKNNDTYVDSFVNNSSLRKLQTIKLRIESTSMVNHDSVDQW